MTPVDVCNLALTEVGSRVLINSFSDNSPQAIVARTNYLPRIHGLFRTASWDFARAQIRMTQWKAALINGSPSPNPPPQPWLFQYLFPPDCVRARFMIPTVPTAECGCDLPGTMSLPRGSHVPTGIPFVIASDLDKNGQPIKTIVTNLGAAQLIYTRDLANFPDQWDPLFLNGVTALLGAYFINALARNAQQYQQQIAASQSVIDNARRINGDEGIPSVDHRPDWMAARQISAGWGWNQQWNQGAGYGGGVGGYDQCVFPDGLRY